MAFFLPDHFFTGVPDLQPRVLSALGIRSLLLDIDATILTYRSRRPVAGLDAWLLALREAKIGVCLLSNGTKNRVMETALLLHLPFVCRAFKPFPFACRRALVSMGFERASTAIVGDQLFADILAGRLAGIKTILVHPVGLEEEPWFTAIKRPLERCLLRWMRNVPRKN